MPTNLVLHLASAGAVAGIISDNLIATFNQYESSLSAPVVPDAAMQNTRRNDGDSVDGLEICHQMIEVQRTYDAVSSIIAQSNSLSMPLSMEMNPRTESVEMQSVKVRGAMLAEIVSNALNPNAEN